MVEIEDLDSFPYPFKGDVYRYSNNSVPLDPPVCIELTSHYQEEMNLKRKLLRDHPERCFQYQPHTIKGQWEALALVIDQLITFYPEQFALEKEGTRWNFQNNILGEEHVFTFGDPSTLPNEPLDFIGRHVQEDLIYMSQRDGDLYLDAGQLCFPANWSLAFNLGMSFKDIHKPIPGFKESGMDQRILNFLLRMEAGDPWIRKNWSLNAGNRLDNSLETFDGWSKNRRVVSRDNAGEFVHLRVEVQKLFRLPGTNGILFTIHTHLISLEQFTSNSARLKQFYSILQELPKEIADYKGISLFRTPVLEYLKDKLT